MNTTYDQLKAEVKANSHQNYRNVQPAIISDITSDALLNPVSTFGIDPTLFSKALGIKYRKMHLGYRYLCFGKHGYNPKTKMPYIHSGYFYRDKWKHKLWHSNFDTSTQGKGKMQPGRNMVWTVNQGRQYIINAPYIPGRFSDPKQDLAEDINTFLHDKKRRIRTLAVPTDSQSYDGVDFKTQIKPLLQKLVKGTGVKLDYFDPKYAVKHLNGTKKSVKKAKHTKKSTKFTIHFYGYKSTLISKHPRIAVFDGFDPDQPATRTNRAQNAVKDLDKRHIIPILKLNGDQRVLKQPQNDKQPIVLISSSNTKKLDDDTRKYAYSMIKNHSCVISPSRPLPNKNVDLAMAHHSNGVLLTQTWQTDGQLQASGLGNALAARKRFGTPIYTIYKNAPSPKVRHLLRQTHIQSISHVFKHADLVNKKQKAKLQQKAKSINVHDMAKTSDYLKQMAWENRHSVNSKPYVSIKPEKSGIDPLTDKNPKIAVISPGMILGSQSNVPKNIRHTVKDLTDRHARIITRLVPDDDIVVNELLNRHAPSIGIITKPNSDLGADSGLLHAFTRRKPDPDLIKKFKDYPKSDEHQKYEYIYGNNMYPSKFMKWSHQIRRQTKQHNHVIELMPNKETVKLTQKALKDPRNLKNLTYEIFMNYLIDNDDVHKNAYSLDQGKQYAKNLSKSDPKKYQAIHQKGVNTFTKGIINSVMASQQDKGIIKRSNGLLLAGGIKARQGKLFSNFTRHNLKSLLRAAKKLHTPVYFIKGNVSSKAAKILEKRYKAQPSDKLLDKVDSKFKVAKKANQATKHGKAAKNVNKAFKTSQKKQDYHTDDLGDMFKNLGSHEVASDETASELYNKLFPNQKIKAATNKLSTPVLNLQTANQANKNDKSKDNDKGLGL